MRKQKKHHGPVTEKKKKHNPRPKKEVLAKNLLKKTCDVCKKRTHHDQTSEGVLGYRYYLDYTCAVCGSVRSFTSAKQQPHIITEYTISTGNVISSQTWDNIQ